MAIFVLAFLVLTAALFQLLRPSSIREAILKSMLAGWLAILVSTEVLSALNRIEYAWVLVFWIAIDSAALALVILFRLKNAAGLWGTKRTSSDRPDPVALICASILVVLGLITLLVSLKAPPNNFDSMTYHLARVSHWIQNRNISYYPTAIPRQNYSLPLAEFVILHLQILSKSDLYANLVQWFSYLAAILAGSLIAKRMGASPRGQWMTAVLIGTLPMAILQSTSTQNDLAVGALCLIFAYFLLKIMAGMNREDIIFSGLALGAALAVKGTAYVFCAAIGLSIAGITLLGKQKKDLIRSISGFLLIILLALVMNTQIYARNIRLYHSPIVSGGERTINEVFSVPVLFANLVRNGAVQLASPLPAANQALNQGITRLLGQQINNPASTFENQSFKIAFQINEDYSGNPLHFLLITAALLVLPWLKKNSSRELKASLLAIALSIIMFSFFFKWQPWGSRLQLPIFLLGSVATGYLLGMLETRAKLQVALSALVFLICLPYLLFNPIRPLMPFWADDSVFSNTPLKRALLEDANRYLDKHPAMKDRVDSFTSLFYEGYSVLHTRRRELYFLGNHELYWPYVGACNAVRDSLTSEVGLVMNSNDWEYPLWMLLKQQAVISTRQVYHIDVSDISGTITTSHNPLPEIVIITTAGWEEFMENNHYTVIYTSGPIQVLQKIQ
jgi:hypothetical protein